MRLRGHRWTPVERAIVVGVLTTVMGALFVVTFSLALADPVPHRIDAALVGNPGDHPRPVAALERAAQGQVALSRYPNVEVALRAVDQQQVFAVLDLTSPRPTLYVASAAGSSVARVLEQATAFDRNMQLDDAHPLSKHDPNGVEIFYLVLTATVIGFFTIFQARANAPLPEVFHRVVFVLSLSLGVSLVLTLTDGPMLDRINLPVAETWGILALQLLVASSFAEVMSFLIGRWAVLPTFLFFFVLGNTASGGAVAPPLLPQPFAFLSQWVPTGVTVTAVRNAVYFRSYQHLRPIVILAAWAVLLFVTWLMIMRRVESRRAAESYETNADTAAL